MINETIAALSLFLQQHPVFVACVVWFVLIVGMLQNLLYALQLPVAWRALRKYTAIGDTETAWMTLLADTTLPIAIIVPAFNEEKVIEQSIRSLLSLEYPEFQVIVVNDGSTDKTLDILKDAFHLKDKVLSLDTALHHMPIKAIYGSALIPSLLVIDKEAGHSKADAINAGINLCRTPLFCVVDADSLLEGGALLRAVRPFIEDPKNMIAVGGTIRILNGCTVKDGHIINVALPSRFLPLVQTLEYIRAFLMARTAFSQWGTLLIVSGAFGLFRRDAVISVGGFSKETVGEDMEMIIKLHRAYLERGKKYAMRYVAEPVCWTQAPSTWGAIMSQRTRWQRGAMESLIKHRRMLFNPRYKKIGMMAIPYSFLVDILGPITEVMGYIIMTVFYLVGAIDVTLFFAFTGLVIFYGIFISLSALLLEEEELWRTPRSRDLIILTVIAIVENFGYRQLNNIWRVIGFIQFICGKKGWKPIPRSNF